MTVLESEIVPAVQELKRQSQQMFPFAPVEAFMREERTSEICDVLGISADLVARFREEGLTVEEADKVACKLLEHPGSIWPEWFDIKPIPDDTLDAIDIFLVDHKECSSCGEWLHIDTHFHRRSVSRDGHARVCKECVRRKAEAKLNG